MGDHNIQKRHLAWFKEKESDERTRRLFYKALKKKESSNEDRPDSPKKKQQLL